MNRAGLDKALQDLVEFVSFNCSMLLVLELLFVFRKSVFLQVYVDAPNEASGPIPDDVKPYFDGPYFEWWNAEKVTFLQSAATYA